MFNRGSWREMPAILKISGFDNNYYGDTCNDNNFDNNLTTTCDNHFSLLLALIVILTVSTFVIQIQEGAYNGHGAGIFLGKIQGSA